MFLFQSPSIFPLNYENPFFATDRKSRPFGLLHDEDEGNGGGKGNRLLALVGVGQPILLLPESGRL